MFSTTFLKTKGIKQKTSQEDYTRDFTDSNFNYFNKHGEGCFVSFFLYMHSFVKFSPQQYNKDKEPLPRSYIETLYLKLVKTHDS